MYHFKPIKHETNDIDVSSQYNYMW